MATTTIRVDEKVRARIADRAKAQGRSMSEVVVGGRLLLQREAQPDRGLVRSVVVKLSVVDLGTVAPGTTEKEALAGLSTVERGGVVSQVARALGRGWILRRI